jgi:hypothetical protein
MTKNPEIDDARDLATANATRARNVTLIALPVGGRSISSNFRFSVMAVPGLDPGIDLAIHENTESGDQVIDNIV